MDFSKLPKEKHKEAINLYRNSKYNRLARLLSNHKVTTNCTTCDKKYLNEWMHWAIVTKTIE